MEKKLRSSLVKSADEFLSAATNISLKQAKPCLKNLIWNIGSSDLAASLPQALHNHITRSIALFTGTLDLSSHKNIFSSPPPEKHLRRSARKSKNSAEPVIKEHKPKSNDDQFILNELHILAYIASLCISHPESAFSSLELFPAVRALHDHLLVFESETTLLSEIAYLCEQWWKEDRPGKESLISLSLPFLLSKSLTSRKKVDVHKVYTLREAFSLFDFDDESIGDLRLLLIRCVVTPLYMKTEEGRRFVIFMFGLNRRLAKEALAMIQSQIPYGRKSMLEAFADIVFRAWRLADGDQRDQIENGFLQRLIEGAIYASSSPLAASIRRVLGGFINQRTVDGVEKILFRLTEPVIFRSLQVANSNVRLNAMHLLLDMFPIEDPDATKETKDVLLDKQFFLLDKLLVDQCPEVRAVAVEGSCRILNLFWEIIPSSTTTKVLTKIIEDMSHDMSNEVRVSTLNGIIYLLGNPLAHEVMKVLLPRLGHMISDSALSVRLAMTDLLLLLRDTRSCQFHKVVGLEELLSALGNDLPSVAQKITRLLMSSYFPSKISPMEACGRCITLIKRFPLGGARFCEFMYSEGASWASILELVQVIFSSIVSPNNLEMDQIEGLLNASAHLCNTLASKAEYKAALKELFSGQNLKKFLSIPLGPRARSSLLDIFFSISAEVGNEILEDCINLVTNCSSLSEDVEKQRVVRSAHKLAISCGWFNNFFEVLIDLIQTAASGCCVHFGVETPASNDISMKRKRVHKSAKIPMKRKRVTGKRLSRDSISTFKENYCIAAGAAWQINDLLISPNSRKLVLESENLGPAFHALKVISEASIINLMDFHHMDISPLLSYTTASLHITVQSISNSSKSSIHEAWVQQTIDHLFFCIEKVITSIESRHEQMSDKALSNSDDGSVWERQKMSTLIKILTTIVKFVVDAASIDVPHEQDKCLTFTSLCIHFMSTALPQFCGDGTPPEILKDIFPCLRSSFTYAAKLLNITLSHSTTHPPPTVCALANNLIDLVALTESRLGAAYSARLVAASRSWLPDLVLALGASHLLSENPTQPAAFCTDLRLPMWPSVLASQSEEEAGERFSSFGRFIDMVVGLARENFDVLDAVGSNLFEIMALGLERKKFGLVLGLAHFICVMLVSGDHGEWGAMGFMLSSLRQVYPIMMREVDDIGESCSEAGKQKLLACKALFEPIWSMYCIV